MPEIPEHLGYVRRIADKGKRASDLIKEYNKTKFFGSLEEERSTPALGQDAER